MSLRDRRESVDPFDALIRHSLQERTANKLPRPEVRRGLLQRAARQQRRLSWRLPVSLSGLLKAEPGRFSHHSSQNHMLYIEALFGPRLGWFSFNQLMR